GLGDGPDALGDAWHGTMLRGVHWSAGVAKPHTSPCPFGSTKGGGAIGSAAVSKTAGCRFESCPPCESSATDRRDRLRRDDERCVTWLHTTSPTSRPRTSSRPPAPIAPRARASSPASRCSCAR